MRTRERDARHAWSPCDAGPKTYLPHQRQARSRRSLRASAPRGAPRRYQSQVGFFVLIFLSVFQWNREAWFGRVFSTGRGAGLQLAEATCAAGKYDTDIYDDADSTCLDCPKGYYQDQTKYVVPVCACIVFVFLFFSKPHLKNVRATDFQGTISRNIFSCSLSNNTHTDTRALRVHAHVKQPIDLQCVPNGNIQRAIRSGECGILR